MQALDTNLTTAIVSASGSVLVAMVAILSNNKRFDDVNRRIDDMNRRIDRLDGRLDSIEQRFGTQLEHIEQLLATYCLDVARINVRLDIK
jgi:flagellar capping protein FliD